MYEKKYRELIDGKSRFISINDIRISRESVKKAVKYLREIYRHRIGKTRVISLNQHTGKTGYLS
jgi:mRNA-degrading endonuclease RelE of RelBE toxin-antitoxin system